MHQTRLRSRMRPLGTSKGCPAMDKPPMSQLHTARQPQSLPSMSLSPQGSSKHLPGRGERSALWYPVTEAACQLCTVAMIRPLRVQFVLPCPWSSHWIQEKIVILDPVQALETAPSGSDPYAAGGQNYYGAGWQADPAAGTPEKPAPPKVSGPGWGKLGFWGAGQPVKEPEQPAQDQGVLYYGAPEVWASSMLYPHTPFKESACYFLLGHWE